MTDPEIPYNASGTQLGLAFKSLLTIAPVFIKHGDVIRLEHKITEKRRHSHDVRAPVSDVEWQNEVSAYGYPGFEGDANDYFRVEIVKSKSKKGVARERLR